MSGRRVRPPQALLEALKRAPAVALYTHVNPDGDGLGSQAALALALQAMGKRVRVANSDPTPKQYAFLGLQAFAGKPAEAEMALALDCPVLERLGSPGAAAFAAATDRVSIDHHIPARPFAELSWVEPSCAATGEMLEALLPALGLNLSPAMATALYAALINDTGCFRHTNTDAAVFGLAVRLLEAGADRTLVHRCMLEEKPLAQVRLQAQALSTLRSLAGGRAALVAVSAADLARFQASGEDTDGLSESLRAIAGVEVGAMLREEGPAVAKLSLRSKSAFDVNAFAGRWGGGGHARAAGATLRLPFAEAVESVAQALDQALAS